MHCPACGVEVVEQAVFCHKCGQRLDEMQPQSAANERRQQELESVKEAARAVADGPPAAPARTPVEKFKQAVAARQEVEDEPERELWAGGYSWKAMIGDWILSTAVSLGLLVLAIVANRPWLWWVVGIGLPGLWIYQSLKLCYRRLNVRYRLTTQRLEHETGILRRATDRIEVIDMDDIAFEQKVLERLVGVGTIRITSSDRSHPKLLLRGIEDVKEVAGKLDDNRRAERRRHGLHIESI